MNVEGIVIKRIGEESKMEERMRRIEKIIEREKREKINIVIKGEKEKRI